MTHSLAASWEITIITSQGCGVSKQASVIPKSQIGATHSKMVAEIKGKQAWLYQDEPKVSFILLWAAVHQHVVRAPVQTFCFHICGC